MRNGMECRLILKYLLQLFWVFLFIIFSEAFKTPLIIAAENQNDEVVRILVQAGASVNRYDALGHTALMLACENGAVTSVELLLDHGADINAVNDQCESPLGNAIRAEN